MGTITANNLIIYSIEENVDVAILRKIQQQRKINMNSLAEYSYLACTQSCKYEIVVVHMRSTCTSDWRPKQ